MANRKKKTTSAMGNMVSLEKLLWLASGNMSKKGHSVTETRTKY